MPSRLANSRFNPAPGVADFWNEFRKPNPLRIPFLLASMAPFGLIFWWLSGETLYKTPERPSITYITTFDPNRSDEEIIASNIANQEVKDLREARQEALAERKRELYKALGAAAGMDVEEIDRRAREERAAEEAAREAELEAMFERDGEDASPDAAGGDGAQPGPQSSTESPAP
ncbi:hypothetical protein EH31_13595 [Erythrobacter longus]|uniref:Uncharacterized protein n=1 Tax=Erythrobacter longus TaxID=1044 RepID=A0A074MB49_ERYLO|nr:hypothetical protein [Erythrobacter longus]KEO89068.1 hypothetical protein EH31_13595 [Erythrobacter longus]